MPGEPQQEKSAGELRGKEPQVCQHMTELFIRWKRTYWERGILAGKPERSSSFPLGHLAKAVEPRALTGNVDWSKTGKRDGLCDLYDEDVENSLQTLVKSLHDTPCVRDLATGRRVVPKNSCSHEPYGIAQGCSRAVWSITTNVIRNLDNRACGCYQIFKASDSEGNE